MQWFKDLLHSISTHAGIFRQAWREQNSQEQTAQAKGKELEFLPAVLELQESPPSPTGRAIGGIIISVFVLGVIWASIGKIDIVAVAQGKIIPSDHTKIIQPLESGVITAINVRDGQHVKAGETLIELDATSTGADSARLTNEHIATLTDIARLKALLANKNTFKAPKGADPFLVSTQRQRLREQLSEYRATKIQADALKKLYEKQVASKLHYLEMERRRAGMAQEISAELAAAETRAHSLSKELMKAETRADQRTLKTPIAGVVQQLAVHTIGGVVTPAQQLMIVVPIEDRLEVEAWVENKDIGFVDPDQIAEIKVDAFPFTKFGTIDGRIESLSLDAVPLENVGHVYAARVSMAKSDILVGNKVVKLSPGMTVSVEIKTGKRRLIEYFLNPLLRGIKETARER